MIETKLEYIKNWQKNNKARTNMYKLKWYYKNRKYINLIKSYPKTEELDEADLMYLEKFPNG